MPASIHADAVAAGDAGRDADDEFTLAATRLHRLVHAADPLCHDGAAGIHFVRVEVVGEVVHLQLEAVDVVVGQGLLDQGETFGAYFLVHEIKFGVALEVFGDTRFGADLQMGVVKAEIGAPHIDLTGSATLLYEQDRIEGEAFLVRPIADDAQWIAAAVDQVTGVLMGTAEDGMGPVLDIVAPQLTHLGVVENGAAVTETEHDGFNRGTGKLIDGSFVLLLLHRRFIHIDERMTAVVVEHDLGVVSHLGLDIMEEPGPKMVMYRVVCNITQRLSLR